jgi:O-antigen ligase
MSHPARWNALRAPALGRNWRLLILAVLAVALALAGGASRFDEDQQAVVRLAAILVLAASLWPLEFKPLLERPGLILAAAAAYLVVLIQLSPLPPGLWAALPGHDVYGRIAAEAGAVGWRPLSLTPDLTANALYALLPATAAGAAALYLEGRQRTWLARGVAAIACASAVAGLFQLAGGGPGLQLYRITSDDAPVGLMANRNHQAALLCCALALTGALVGLRRRDLGDPRVGLILGIGLAALLVLAVVSTGSRMGLILAAIGALGGLWAYKAAGGRLLPRRAVLRLAAVAGVLTITAGLALAAIHSGAVDRLAHTSRAGETRAAMIDPLVETARAFMPFGAGFGAFDSAFRRFEPASLLSTIYMNQAHNEPLQLAIEGGLPALALLTAFLVWWVWTAAAIFRRGAKALSIAWMTVTVILMASSLVDYPLRTPLLGAVFAVACVEMARAAGRPSELRLRPPVRDIIAAEGPA